MRFEKSAGAIIFRREGSEILFLLLNYPGVQEEPYWDFVKGHIEEKELEKQTVIRETFEETGIEDLEFIDNFKKEISYVFEREGNKIFKEVVFYLAETKTKDIKISPEHIGFKWLSFLEAINLMRFKEPKKILNLANDFLEKNKKTL